MDMVTLQRLRGRGTGRRSCSAGSALTGGEAWDGQSLVLRRLGRRVALMLQPVFSSATMSPMLACRRSSGRHQGGCHGANNCAVKHPNEC